MTSVHLQGEIQIMLRGQIRVGAAIGGALAQIRTEAVPEPRGTPRAEWVRNVPRESAMQSERAPPHVGFEEQDTFFAPLRRPPRYEEIGRHIVLEGVRDGRRVCAQPLGNPPPYCKDGPVVPVREPEPCHSPGAGADRRAGLGAGELPPSRLYGAYQHPSTRNANNHQAMLTRRERVIPSAPSLEATRLPATRAERQRPGEPRAERVIPSAPSQDTIRLPPVRVERQRVVPSAPSLDTIRLPPVRAERQRAIASRVEQSGAAALHSGRQRTTHPNVGSTPVPDYSPPSTPVPDY